MDTTGRDRIYEWIYKNDDKRQEERLFNVGILKDGTLHNPNGYPEEVVRSAFAAGHRRAKSAKEARFQDWQGDITAPDGFMDATATCGRLRVRFAEWLCLDRTQGLIRALARMLNEEGKTLVRSSRVGAPRRREHG